MQRNTTESENEVFIPRKTWFFIGKRDEKKKKEWLGETDLPKTAEEVMALKK